MSYVSLKKWYVVTRGIYRNDIISNCKSNENVLKTVIMAMGKYDTSSGLGMTTTVPCHETMKKFMMSQPQKQTFAMHIVQYLKN